MAAFAGFEGNSWYKHDMIRYFKASLVPFKDIEIIQLMMIIFYFLKDEIFDYKSEDFYHVTLYLKMKNL